MNPLVIEALASIARWLLALGAGYLVREGVWTEGQAATYVSAAALAAVSLGWSVWQKYRSRQKLVTALALPVRMSEKDVEAVVDIAPSPVSTPKNEVPQR